MLIDSGNLVNDLISADFAEKLKIKCRPVRKKIGTAAKGGSVQIIGRSPPIKIFIENISKPVIIEPYVVKDLAHPINVGRDFLGRYGGRLEFNPEAGYLEITGQKTKMVNKRTELNHSDVTDERIRKALQQPGVKSGHHNEMIHEGIFNICGAAEGPPVSNISIFCKETQEIPACSARFVPFHTGGKLPLSVAKAGILQIEPTEEDSEKIQMLIMPSLCQVLDGSAYCLVVNPQMSRTTLQKDAKLGTVSVLESPDEDENEISVNHFEDENKKKQPPERIRTFIEKELNLRDNEILKNDPDLAERVIQLFIQYEDTLSKHEFDYGHTTAVQCQIQLKPGEEVPVKLKARPLNPAQEESMRLQLEEWEKSGIIEKTQSPWAFPMVGVKKKGSNQIRWCVDYRLLNQKTVKDAYPLSSIESNLHKLQGSKFFTTLDSAGAYHAVEIHPESREYTAFITPFGQYQFARMPFGLSNAGACYSRLVSLALQYLPGNYALAYLDDIIIFSQDTEQHLKQLEDVLQIHRKFGMKLRVKKCKIFQTEVEYLGHMVSEDGIRMVPGYVDKILNWPLPETGKQLKQFLGFIGYYRGFIPDVADLTYEMNDMKKGAQLQWTSEVREKFETLKKRFAEAPLRSYPDYSSDTPFILDTDFSKTNMAAVLSQVQRGEEKFIGAGARKCNTAERNYPSHKGELAAVVMGLRKFEHILRFKRFVLRTDSRCMQFLTSLKEVRGIYARWLNFIQSFDFEVIHRPGKKNINADALSRIEELEEVPPDDEELKDYEEDIYAAEIEDVEEWLKKGVLERQKQDPILRCVIEWVEKEEKPSKEELRDLANEYKVYVGVFEMLKISAAKGLIYIDPKTQIERICMPVELFQKIFKWAHEHVSAGHFGISATQKRLRSRFFIPNLDVRVVTAVTNCVNCIQKRNYIDKNQHMFHRSLETGPFQKIYVDIVGPLAESEWNGTKVSYIVTMMDGFTKWAEAIPVSDITVQTVANVIVENWIARYGIPDQIHSDQGAQFTSEIYRELMRMLGVKVTHTPPYNPRSNKVERLHRVLGEILRSDQTGPPDEWPSKLPWALFAHRTAVSNATGVTPFQAVFGSNSKIPLDIIFPMEDKPREKWPEYVEKLQKKIQQIHAQIRRHAKLGAQRATAFQSGKISQHKVYTVGDVVYYFSPRIDRVPGKRTSRKLTLLWTGPYEVKKKISDTLVLIYPLGEWAKNPREILTVIDKLRKLQKPIAEVIMRPDTQIDLDDIEETLEDYGEYIQEQIQEPREKGVPIYTGDAPDSIVDIMSPRPEPVKNSGGIASGYTGTHKPHSIYIATERELGGDTSIAGSPVFHDARVRKKIVPQERTSSENSERDDTSDQWREDGRFSPHLTVNDESSDKASSHKLSIEEDKLFVEPESESITSENQEISSRDVESSSHSEIHSRESDVPGTRRSVEHQKRKRHDTEVTDTRPKTRTAALLARALLSAGASMERYSKKYKAESMKRKAGQSKERDSKKERIEERGESGSSADEDEEGEEHRSVNMLDSSEESGTEAESDKNEREDREEDEIQEIGRVEGRRKKKLPKGRKAQRGIADFELPVRVQLHKDVKDHKGRSMVPLLEEDISIFKKRIAEGTTKMKKTITLTKEKGGPLILVEVKLQEIDDDPLSSEEVEEEMKTNPMTEEERKLTQEILEKIQKLGKNRKELMGARKLDMVGQLVEKLARDRTILKINEAEQMKVGKLTQELVELKEKCEEERRQFKNELAVAQSKVHRSEIKPCDKEAYTTALNAANKRCANLRAQLIACEKELKETKLVRGTVKQKDKEVQTEKGVKSTVGVQVNSEQAGRHKDESETGEGTRPLWNELKDRMDRFEGEWPNRIMKLEAQLEKYTLPKSVEMILMEGWQSLPESDAACKFIADCTLEEGGLRQLEKWYGKEWCSLRVSNQLERAGVALEGDCCFRANTDQVQFQLVFDPASVDEKIQQGRSISRLGVIDTLRSGYGPTGKIVVRVTKWWHEVRTC